MSELNTLLKSIKKHDAKRLRPIFDRHGLGDSKSLYKLAEQIRRDGSNGFANLWRGEGVPYEEVVFDVCMQVKAPLKGSESLEEMEGALLAFITEKYFASLSEEERRSIEEQIENVAPGQGMTHVLTALKAAGAAGGVIGRQVAVQVVTQVLQQVALRMGVKWLGQNAALAAGAIVPGLNVLMAAWFVNDLAGPAYRKTVPTVIELSLLRLEVSD